MNRITPEVYKSTFLAVSASDWHSTLGGGCYYLHFIADESVVLKGYGLRSKGRQRLGEEPKSPKCHPVLLPTQLLLKVVKREELCGHEDTVAVPQHERTREGKMAVPASERSTESRVRAGESEQLFKSHQR